MTSKNSISCLQELAYKSFQNYLDKTIIKLLDTYKENYKKYDKELQFSIKNITKHIQTYLPPMFHNQICNTIFDILGRINSTTESDNAKTSYFTFIPTIKKSSQQFKENVFEQIIANLIFELHITKFSYLQVPCQQRQKLHLYLHKLKSLQYLKVVEYLPRTIFTNPQQYFQNAFVHMSNLVELIYTTNCSDFIIKILAQHCKSLIYLNVSFSKNVTNKSIESLNELNNLQVLEIENTCIDVYGYMALLTEHPSLTRIETLLELCDALRQIKETANIILKLTEIKGTEITTKDLKLIEKFSPNLNLLQVFCKQNVDFSVVQSFPNLQHFSVTYVQFYKNGINKFLENVGENIVTLYFFNCGGFDLNALVTIDQMCPKLEKLIFECCYTERNNENVENQLPDQMFQHVKHLEFCEGFPKDLLKVFLSKCCNIETLIMAYMQRDLHETMRLALNSNEMKLLKTIYCNEVYHFPLGFLEKWLRTCSSLECMYGIHRYGPIQYSYLDHLEEKFPHLKFNGKHTEASFRKWSEDSGICELKIENECKINYESE